MIPVAWVLIPDAKEAILFALLGNEAWRVSRYAVGGNPSVFIR